MISSWNLRQQIKLLAVMSLANLCRAGLTLLLVVGLPYARLALADEQQDRAMRKLSTESGCSFCHKEEPSKRGVDELLPVAPSWTDIARRYRGQPGAEDRLTKVVMIGSGRGPNDRHWAYKVRDTSMPSSFIEISREDARGLVRWILSRK
jgi:cytochrome c